MSATNKTPNYDLPQWIGSDHPTWQGDLNAAFLTIDSTMKANAEEIENAKNDATGSVEYFTMTCDLWDNGTIAAKAPTQEDTGDESEHETPSETPTE